MRTFRTVRERLRIAKGRLREYEGRVRKLDAQLVILRGQLTQTRGRARLRLLRLDRQIRGTVDTTLKAIDRVTKEVNPRIRRVVDRAEAIRHGINAGIKAGTATYRRRRSK